MWRIKVKSAFAKGLQQAGLIVVIIVGGLVMGALTPAYSQDGGVAAAAAH